MAGEQVGQFADRIRCPVMVVHGWHDVGMPAHDLLGLFARLEVPKLLYLGGGGHDGEDDARERKDRTDLVDRWLAHWLDGEDTGLLRGPPIRCVRRPGWEVVQLEVVSPRSEAALYLRHGGALSAEPPPDPTPNSNVQHRPLDPSYTLSAALDRDLAGSLEAWPREEVWFDGPPLEAPLDLCGAPVFELHVLPERTWFQVHAALCEVGPDGRVQVISRGHAGAHDAEPGRHRRLEIAGRPIAWRVAAGSHLRLVVADQDLRHVVPEYRPWRARLFHEPGRASRVVLPLGP